MLNFNNVFSETDNSKAILPSELVNYLSKKNLPSGIHYVSNQNGVCIATGEKEETNISGFKPKLSKSQEKELGKSYSITDLLEYSYNSQTKIELQLDKEGVIKLNDNEVSIDKIVIDPLHPIETKGQKIYLLPPKFPEPFNLKIKNKKYKKNLTISRISSNIKDVICYESDKSDSLFIEYSINKKRNTIKMEFSIILKNSKSIKDIVTSITIYNSVFDGEAYINDIPMKKIHIEGKVKKYDENSALFWEKVYELEQSLGVTFIPPIENVDFTTICDVETLYQNIIKKTPIRDNNIVNVINGNWEEKEIDNLKKFLGKPLFFKFKGTYETELFGISIKQPAIFALYNSTLKDFNDNKKIVLEDESDDKKRYTVVQCFLSESEAENYMDKNEISKKFEKAKKISDYIK